MDDAAKGVVSECTIASDEDRITFPEVVGKLMAVGVERYHADFVRAEKTYYHPDGSFQVVPAHRVPGTPATAFSAQDVSAAVADSQAGTIQYSEFCRRVVAAGCVGSLVSIVGRRVVYFGRTGESHVELFPSLP